MSQHADPPFLCRLSKQLLTGAGNGVHAQQLPELISQEMEFTVAALFPPPSRPWSLAGVGRDGAERAEGGAEGSGGSGLAPRRAHSEGKASKYLTSASFHHPELEDPG